MNTDESLANVEIWSENEFGNAGLGNKSRVDRLIIMAAGAANAPAGKITGVYRTSAEKQGAYKFIESPYVDTDAIGLAAHVACARRCSEGNRSLFGPLA